jgi:hypothetical protein
VGRVGTASSRRHLTRRSNSLQAGAATTISSGHTLAVWDKHYARSFGKSQRDEARDRMLAFGFGAIEDDDTAEAADPVSVEQGPLA